jgi:dTDP-4-dehydrorhamnose reductase
MNKVILFGANGMLGRYVHKYLESQGIEVVPMTRANCDITQNESNIMYDIGKTITGHISEYIIVNCAGIIKSRQDIGMEEYIKVNSLFPHFLQKIANDAGTNLIHITTDCVFSGSKDLIRNDKYYNGYTELSNHDPLDVYGKTKSLGEPEEATVIRTSIIGREKGSNRSLIEWVLSNEGKTINGYTNHFWNGMTCLQLAKVIHQVIEKRHFWQGVMHMFTPEVITKYDLVELIANTFMANIEITPVKDNNYEMLNRTLKTHYSTNTLYNIPSYNTQLEELAKFSID